MVLYAGSKFHSFRDVKTQTHIRCSHVIEEKKSLLLHDRLPKKLFVWSSVPALQGALGLVIMMLHQVIVMNAALLGHTRVLRTDCFGETRLVLHVPSSS